MTGITKWNDTGNDMFCKSQLITCNRVKECNGVCPFEDALKHADKEMDEQTVIDHDRDWIIGCLEHDGFIHTDRFDKANQIIHDALSAEAVQGWIPCSERLPKPWESVMTTICWVGDEYEDDYDIAVGFKKISGDWDLTLADGTGVIKGFLVQAWMPLPKPYREDGEV